MADIVIFGAGTSKTQVSWSDVASKTVLSLDLITGTNVVGSGISYTRSNGTGVVSTDSIPLTEIRTRVNLANAYSTAGVSFDQGGKRHVVKAGGDIQTNLSPTTGVGVSVGSIANDLITLDTWTPGTTPAVTKFAGVATAPVNGPFTPFGGYEVMFRTAVAPLRTGSLSVLGELVDGTTFNVVANDQGVINAARVKGRVNFASGVVTLFFVSPTATVPTQTLADISFLDIPGVTTVYLDRARIETLRYNAVAFNYMPLDASLLGIDPVRLPSDGRVPIFRPGRLAVIGNTQTTAAATASDGQTVNLGRTRLSRVRVIGNNGVTINTGYTVNLNAGTVTFVNVSGYSQPVRIEHRIEDMVQVRDAQINGDISFNPALSHDYTVGDTYISSAVAAGDMTARVPLLFDQGSWDGITFSDNLIGSAALGTYNDTISPIVVTNAGAETERFVLRFTSPTAYQVIGENLGVIDTGSINAVCAPINPVTNEPYFTIDPLGWGVGWATGNIVRFNTVGARFPLWCVRTVRQGAATGVDYSFSLLTRGDVDNPL